MPMLFRAPYGPPSAIINAYSSGGVSLASLDGLVNFGCVRLQAAGAYSVTPNTLQTILSHTGRGRVNVLNVFAGNATARTIRLKLTVDGVVIFDATSNSISATATGMMVIGVLNSSFIELQPIDYNESLLIECASSVSNDAASNIQLGISRETWVS